MAIGWSQTYLAVRLGRKCRSSLGPLLWTAGRQYVTPAVAGRVRALYDELWQTPGPSLVTRRRAAAKGWPPPLWWDDDEIDNPAAPAEPYEPFDEVEVARVRRQDRLAEVARLTERGLSAQQIAGLVGVSSRQVVRDRADLHKLPPAAADGTHEKTRTTA